MQAWRMAIAQGKAARSHPEIKEEERMDNVRIVELQKIRDDLTRTKETLGALISWMAHSAHRAEVLLKQLMD
jgi:hypothetical protein